jgi:hypothetical protein
MRNHGRFLVLAAPALSALLLASGCGLLPGNIGLSSEPTPSPTKTGTPHPLVGPAVGANTIAPVTGPGPSPVMPLNLAGPDSPQDVISIQAQSLKAAEDDHKLLAARLLQLEAALQDKEKALAEAAEDITRTADEVGRTRADIRKVRQENADLREKLDKTQKELIEVQKENIRLREKEQEPDGPPMVPEADKEP